MASNGIVKRRRLAAAWDGRRYLNSARVPAFTAPSNLVVTPSGTTNALTWTNGTASAQTKILRSPTELGSYTEMATVSAGVASYNDTGLANGTYWYKVAHLYNSNNSSQTTGSSGTISGSTGSRTIAGSGFGGEPTVVFFDRATGSVGAPYSSSADVGTVSSFRRYPDEDDAVTYIEHDGRTWMAGRNPISTNSTTANFGQLTISLGALYTQYYVEWRVVIPTGFCFPGASPNVNSKTWTDTDSRWKMVWGSNSAYGETTTTDVVFYNLAGAAQIIGNGCRPTYGTTTSSSLNYFSSSGTSAVNANLLGAYMSEGSTVSAFDGVFEMMQANGSSVTRTVRNNARNWYGYSSALPAIGHNTFNFNGWTGNITHANVQYGYADMYLAVGANSRARVYAHNAATIAASTQIYNVTACKSAWSNASITVTDLAPRESLPYMSVISADGTLHENVSWS